MAVDQPAICQVAVNGTYQGETFVNVLHFARKDQADLNVGDLVSISNLLISTGADSRSLKKLYVPMDAGLVLSGIKAVSLSESAPLSVSTATAIAGTSVGNDYPAMTAVVAKWSTGYASKRAQGRTYIPGLNVGFVQTADPDRFDSAWVVSRAADYQAFAGGWTADATYDFIIYSRENAEEFPAVFAGYPVLTAGCNPLVAIQRRRRPRS